MKGEELRQETGLLSVPEGDSAALRDPVSRCGSTSPKVPLAPHLAVGRLALRRPVISSRRPGYLISDIESH